MSDKTSDKTSGKMRDDPKIIAALNLLAARNNGLLEPAGVVKEARSEKSPLHSWFDWDETEAAHKWRLHQARNLLRVMVTYSFSGKRKIVTRVYVSLTTDRGEGGYRTTVSVMSDPELRAQLLADALDEMKLFERKYAALQELAEVFMAMRKARKPKDGG